MSQLKAAATDDVKSNLTGRWSKQQRSTRRRVPETYFSNEESDRLKSTRQALWMM